MGYGGYINVTADNSWPEDKNGKDFVANNYLECAQLCADYKYTEREKKTERDHEWDHPECHGWYYYHKNCWLMSTKEDETQMTEKKSPQALYRPIKGFCESKSGAEE